MGVRIGVVGIVILVFCGGAVSAQEFVEFRDGRYIKAASHRLGGEWMRIELGKGSWIEVPRDVVDVVEYRGRRVYSRPAPSPDDVLLAGGGTDSRSIAPLVGEVIRTRRRLPDPSTFRLSPPLLARRIRLGGR